MASSEDISQDSFSGALCFPTMIFTIQCHGHEDLNDYLVKLIRVERERDATGINRSNFSKLGGWHSQSNLHRDQRYMPIVERVNQAGERISEQLGYDRSRTLTIGTMWSIINGPRSMNKAHIHPGAHWSGVYYIRTPEGCGDIEFTDPRTPHVMNEPRYDSSKKRAPETWTKVQLTPKAGMMLLFPSWLYHSVAPNMSEEPGEHAERVIISFNLSQNKFV